MKKCPKCGYERTQKDDSFVSVAECPKCGVFYEKEIAYIDKQKKIAEEEKLREEERLIAEEKLRAEEELKEAARQQNEVNESSTIKKCPYCAEEIKSDAVKCRYCGEWLNQQTAKQTVSPVKSKAPDSLNFSDKIVSKWYKMSFGKKVLTGFLIFVFIFWFLSIIDHANNNNREVSQQQVPQPQRVEQQAVQTQARIEAQETQSRDLLSSCKRSCSSMEYARSFNEQDRLNADEARCKRKCEQDALTRNIEIEKLRQMQK